MSSRSDSILAAQRSRIFTDLLPVASVASLLYAIAVRGLTDPATLLVVVAVAALGLATALERIPLVALTLVPVSMCVFFYLPLLHYEALVLAIGLLLLLRALPRTRLAPFRLDSLQWRYALFVASMLPALFFSVNLWTFFGSIKVFIVGLVGFEVARLGARKFGRPALLWGPALFMLVTAAMLGYRILELGLPGFKSIILRTYITRLPWGTSNYVAAVQVLCMPTLAMLFRLAPARSLTRFASTSILAATLLALLVTSSRGGFALAMLYLLALTIQFRRSLIVSLALSLVFGIVVASTPYGQGLLARFTNRQNLDSAFARVQIWGGAWARGVTHLPFGVGAGQGPTRMDALAWIDPHNFLLTLFSESGPVCAVIWLWLLSTLWGRAVRADGSAENREAGFALRATVALAFFNSLFEPTFTGNLYYLLFWWQCGIFVAVPERPRVGGPSHQRDAAGPGSGQAFSV
jgi:hypothetical protein